MSLLADAVLDAALNNLKTTVNEIHLTNGFDPAIHDRAWVLANTLGGTAVASGNWTGPSDGPVDGRVITLAQLSATAVASLGPAAGDLRIVLISATEWLYWTNETSEKEIVSGESFDFPTIPIRIRDPA